jgi:hypothetical protein
LLYYPVSSDVPLSAGVIISIPDCKTVVNKGSFPGVTVNTMGGKDGRFIPILFDFEKRKTRFLSHTLP